MQPCSSLQSASIPTYNTAHYNGKVFALLPEGKNTLINMWRNRSHCAITSNARMPYFLQFHYKRLYTFIPLLIPNSHIDVPFQLYRLPSPYTPKSNSIKGSS